MSVDPHALEVWCVAIHIVHEGFAYVIDIQLPRRQDGGFDFRVCCSLEADTTAEVEEHGGSVRFEPEGFNLNLCDKAAPTTHAVVEAAFQHLHMKGVGKVNAPAPAPSAPPEPILN